MIARVPALCRVPQKLLLTAALLFALTALPVAAEVTYPPELPKGAKLVSTDSPDLLKAPVGLLDGVTVAKTAPMVDLMYFPAQTYPGKTWSNWGDSLFSGGKYYCAIGDHDAPQGNGYVYEYDPQKRELRQLAALTDVIKKPEGHYSPSKIHTRLDMGSDGWLYYGTHRGSTRVTTDEYHYGGDWILRTNPKTGETQVVTHAPVGKRCIPTGRLDPKRLIYYGGAAEGDFKDKRVTFFAYDVKNDKLLYSGYEGPYRYLIYAPSNGCVYFTPSDDEPLRRYDPAKGGSPEVLDVTLGLRAATSETPDGIVYTSSRDGELFAFDTKTEKARSLGSGKVGKQGYIATLDADPTGRYLYYVPGAHGGAYRDGTPVVQFDIKTGGKKVLAFLYPALQKEAGYVPIGTYGLSVDSSGERLYITFNGSREPEETRGRYPFDTCAMTVIHIPASERKAVNNLPGRKSSVEEIRARFDADVERFSNLETGQSATIDAPLVLELMAQAAAAVTAQASHVLDVGCGAGNHTLKLLECLPNLNVSLVDLSRPMLDRAQERISVATAGSVATIQADIRELPLESESVDIFLAAAVLHHLRCDEEWDAVFVKFNRALRPGGSLWIFDLVESGIPSLHQLLWRRYGEYLTSLRDEAYRDQVFEYIQQEDSPRPLIEQLDRLKAAGFEQVEVLHKNGCFAAFGAVK